jgi:hypothetical protein
VTAAENARLAPLGLRWELSPWEERLKPYKNDQANIFYASHADPPAVTWMLITDKVQRTQIELQDSAAPQILAGSLARKIQQQQEKRMGEQKQAEREKELTCRFQD